MVRGKKGTHEAVFEELTKDGFNRVRVNGKIYKLDNIKHELTLGSTNNITLKLLLTASLLKIQVSDGSRKLLSTLLTKERYHDCS